MINEMHYLVIDRKAAKLNFCTPKFNMLVLIQGLVFVGVRCFSIAEHFSVHQLLEPFCSGFIHFSNLTGLIEKRDKISCKNM